MILALTVAAAFAQPASPAVEVFVRFDGSVYVGDRLVMDSEITQAVREATAGDDTRVVVNADSGVTYGRVIQVVDRVAAAGVTDVGFAIEGGATRAADPLFPGAPDAAEKLEDLSKQDLKQLKPKRHRFPQDPYAYTDYTAYTLDWGETRIGPLAIQSGILPRIHVGTVPLLDIVGLPNVQGKANIVREGPLDGSVQVAYLAVPITKLVDRYSGQLGLPDGQTDAGQAIFTARLGFLALGGTTSLQIVKPWSIHVGADYLQASARGQWTLDQLPGVVVPDGMAFGEEGNTSIATGVAVEGVQMRFATDLRFNRRDSIVFQYRSLVYANARAGAALKDPGFLGGGDMPFSNTDLRVNVAWGGMLPLDTQYALSLAYQFSWKHVDLRFGIGASAPVPGLWLNQAFVLTYRFGGETRRQEARIRRAYRENRRDIREGEAGTE